MVSTYASYVGITRDLAKSLDRVEKQPVVERDTAYFRKAIAKVTSIDAFMADDRLYRTAMKAFGLEEMTYAKAFMRKALEGGISDPDSFANKLNDKRYAEFVKTFNFAGLKERTTNYAQAREGAVDRYTILAFKAGVPIDNPVLVKRNQDYQAAVSKVTSVDEFLGNDFVYQYAMRAFGLDAAVGDKTFMRQILEGGVADPDSLANRQKDTAFATFAAAFNFAEHGKEATTYRNAVEGVEAKFVRQKLEEDAGSQNEGVRLALNFERKAAKIGTWYDVLADKALAEVVRTALSLPDSFAAADLDKQVAFFKSKLDIADFSDPKALGKFLKRFTALWDAGNSDAATSAASPASLFQGAAAFGISTNLMLTMQQLKF